MARRQNRCGKSGLVARLEAEGHEVADSIIADAPPETAHQALWYLGQALQIMAACDAVYCMEGWSSARGCRLEWTAAQAYGLAVLDGDWVMTSES